MFIFHWVLLRVKYTHIKSIVFLAPSILNYNQNYNTFVVYK